MVGLREEVLKQNKIPSVKGKFDHNISLAKELAVTVTTLTKAISTWPPPFSSGSGNDVRITTRTDQSDPFNRIYSTIHEVGHATYEQNINKNFIFLLSVRVSLGVHESQADLRKSMVEAARSQDGCFIG